MTIEEVEAAMVATHRELFGSAEEQHQRLEALIDALGQCHQGAVLSWWDGNCIQTKVVETALDPDARLDGN